MKFSRKNVKEFVQNLKKYLISVSAFVAKLWSEVVGNVHHIDEPLVAYNPFN